MTSLTANPTSEATSGAFLTNSTDLDPVRLTSGAPTGPRVYVASLSDYNAGRLHGVWIDATDEPADICRQVEAMLARSPEWGAEEYAIHDAEGFCGLDVDEWMGLDRLHAVARLISEHPEPEAVAAWLGNDPSVVDVNNADPDELASAFDDAYRGCWSSVEEYAAEMVDSWGLLSGVDETVARYFDFDAFARDLVLGGDIWTAPADGGVYVFDAHAG